MDDTNAAAQTARTTATTQMPGLIEGPVGAKADASQVQLDTSLDAKLDSLEAQEMAKARAPWVAALAHSGDATKAQQDGSRTSPDLPTSDIGSHLMKDQSGGSVRGIEEPASGKAMPAITDDAADPMPSARWPDMEAQEKGESRETHSINGSKQPPHTTAYLHDVPLDSDVSMLKASMDSTPHHQKPAALKDLPYDPGNGINLDEDEPVAPDTFASGSFAIPTSQIESSSGEATFFESAASINDADVRVKAYAKLEFPDGQFFMNTYSLMLGRDIRAAKAHEIAHVNSETHLHKRRRRSGREDHRNIASSVVSESGGIVGVGVQEPAARVHADAAMSKSGSSEPLGPSRNDSTYSSILNTDYQTMGMASLGLVAHGGHSVDARSLLPSPDECPLIPIHPPVVESGASAGYKGISRVHARISYNFARSLFELEVLGRNGLFIDETHFAQSEITELKNGSIIQIGGVRIKFVLPDVAVGETGAEGTTLSGVISGSAMSFDFEDGRGANVAMAESSSPTTGEGDFHSDQYESEHQALARMSALAAELENQESESDEVDEEVEQRVSLRRHQSSYRKASQGWKSKAKTRGPPSKTKSTPRLKLNVRPREPTGMKEQSDLDVVARPPLPPRKGPGRPPKNGYMSKRQEQELKRQAKAEAAARGPPHHGAKAGHPGPLPMAPEKRKYKKRASKADLVPQDVVPTTETSLPPESAKPMAKPPKEKRPPKPPRSPSPVWDISTLTEEQLQKPPLSYVVLIHEALSNSPTGQMSLPQIYRAIERKYPWYKLRVTTQGWQSSVRHNLSQHGAFQKIERDGKGWMWGLVADFPIEKDKKQRRPSPPLPSRPPQQAYYPPNGHPPPPYPYAGMAPPNGFMPPPGGQPPYSPYPGPHFPGSHGYVQPGMPRAPNGFPIPLAMPRPDSSATYQSPYGNSSAPSNPMQASQTSAMAGCPPSTTSFAPTITTPDQDRPSSLDCSDKPTHTRAILSDQEHVIQKFKRALVASMPKYPNADQMVTQAINRVLEISPQASDPLPIAGPEEETIMHAFRNLLNILKEKERQKSQALSPQTGTSQTPIPRLTPNGASADVTHDTPKRSSTQAEPDVAAKEEQSPNPQMPSESQEQIVQILAQLGERPAETEMAAEAPNIKTRAEDDDAAKHDDQPVRSAQPVDRSPAKRASAGKGSKDTAPAMTPRAGRSRGKRAIAEMANAGDDEMFGMPTTRSKRLAT